MVHLLMESRIGLTVDAALTHATGTAERQATMVMLDRRKRKRTSKRRISLKPTRPMMSPTLSKTCASARWRYTSPQRCGQQARQGPQNGPGPPHTRHAGYAVNQILRKWIEGAFGWINAQAGLAKVKVRGRGKAEAVFTFAVAACNLIHTPNLLAESPYDAATQTPQAKRNP